MWAYVAQVVPLHIDREVFKNSISPVPKWCIPRLWLHGDDCKPAVLPPPVSTLPGVHPHVAHLWAAQTAAFIIRVRDLAVAMNKCRKMNLWEKLSLLSPELPWLAGEHWQDLVLDQRQLFWAPGHNGCGAAELVVAVLAFTRYGPSPLRQVNLNSI